MMKINRRHFLGAVAAGSTGLIAPRAFATVRTGPPPALLAQAKAALDRHGSSVRQRDVLGLVDFSLNSGTPRFYLVDVAGGRVAQTWLVAHGRGSDPGNSGWVQHFSNRPGSNASSEGSFLLDNPYYGKHGRSRRLRGLDPENSLAFDRAIVVHGAAYVSQSGALAHGRVGRSLGCFAVAQGTIDEVLARLGQGRLLFAGK